MAREKRTFRLGLQAKILIPVMAFLILIPAATVVTVERHFSVQQLDSAQQDLKTANEVFEQLLNSQADDIKSRFGLLTHDNGLYGILDKRNDPEHFGKTVEEFARERLAESNGKAAAILFVINGGQPPAGYAVHGAPFTFADFVQATRPLTQTVLNGDEDDPQPAEATLFLKTEFVHVVAIPVAYGSVRGALVAGVPIGDTNLQELKKLTDTDILLLSGEKVVASTLPEDAELSRQLMPLVESRPAGDAPDLPSQAVTARNGTHYLALSGSYDEDGPGRGFRYILLSNYEQSLAALANTRSLLVEISVIGIAISALAVWLLVRRFIQPLGALGESAEAVGRGDFSRRIEIHSNDETGDLAGAFNRMTASLQTSRAELEKALETVKATQNQLVQSEKLSAVGQFVAGVAHELNNPLAAVIGFSDLLVQTGDAPQVQPQLELIAKSAHRCHKIVQNLLSFARQRAPERKLVQINGVIDEVLEIMAYDFRTSNIQIVRDFEPNLPPITVDPHQLQQVFVNILSNARQAIEPFRPDGSITVRTRCDGSHVRIELADNGPGIRPENVSRIFDPFFTTKPVGKGTGLGLSLVYGIVQEHGGKIRVESDLGHGATFVIELPASAASPSQRETAPRALAPRPRAAQPSGKTILVVDDEDWILLLVRQLLENEGHSVQTASSGDQAVQAIRGKTFDVIVCDWKMPGLNGIQLYEHLKAVDPTMADRILFMSGDIINETFQKFLVRNGKSCLPKPFQIEEFREAVDAMLARA